MTKFIHRFDSVLGIIVLLHGCLSQPLALDRWPFTPQYISQMLYECHLVQLETWLSDNEFMVFRNLERT